MVESELVLRRFVPLSGLILTLLGHFDGMAMTTASRGAAIQAHFLL
jgi:hypothetical protein